MSKPLNVLHIKLTIKKVMIWFRTDKCRTPFAGTEMHYQIGKGNYSTLPTFNFFVVKLQMYVKLILAVCLLK